MDRSFKGLCPMTCVFRLMIVAFLVACLGCSGAQTDANSLKVEQPSEETQATADLGNAMLDIIFADLDQVGGISEQEKTALLESARQSFQPDVSGSIKVSASADLNEINKEVVQRAFEGLTKDGVKDLEIGTKVGIATTIVRGVLKGAGLEIAKARFDQIPEEERVLILQNVTIAALENLGGTGVTDDQLEWITGGIVRGAMGGLKDWPGDKAALSQFLYDFTLTIVKWILDHEVLSQSVEPAKHVVRSTVRGLNDADMKDQKSFQPAVRRVVAGVVDGYEEKEKIKTGEEKSKLFQQVVSGANEGIKEMDVPRRERLAFSVISQAGRVLVDEKPLEKANLRELIKEMLAFIFAQLKTFDFNNKNDIAQKSQTLSMALFENYGWIFRQFEQAEINTIMGEMGGVVAKGLLELALEKGLIDPTNPTATFTLLIRGFLKGFTAGSVLSGQMTVANLEKTMDKLTSGITDGLGDSPAAGVLKAKASEIQATLKDYLTLAIHEAKKGCLAFGGVWKEEAATCTGGANSFDSDDNIPESEEGFDEDEDKEPIPAVITAINDDTSAFAINEMVEQNTPLEFTLMPTGIAEDDATVEIKKLQETTSTFELLNASTGLVKYTPPTGSTGTEYLAYSIKVGNYQSSQIPIIMIVTEDDVVTRTLTGVWDLKWKHPTSIANALESIENISPYEQPIFKMSDAGVAALGFRNQTEDLLVRTYKPAQWKTPVTISETKTRGGKILDIAIDKDENFMALVASGQDNQELYLIERLNGQVSQPKRLNGGEARSIGFAKIAMTDQNRAVIAWDQGEWKRSKKRQKQVAYWVEKVNGSWSQQAPLFGILDEDAYKKGKQTSVNHVLINENADALVLWSVRCRRNCVDHYVSHRVGGTWSHPSTRKDALNHFHRRVSNFKPSHISASLNSKGQAVISWAAKRKKARIYAATYMDGVWSKPGKKKDRVFKTDELHSLIEPRVLVLDNGEAIISVVQGNQRYYVSNRSATRNFLYSKYRLQNGAWTEETTNFQGKGNRSIDQDKKSSGRNGDMILPSYFRKKTPSNCRLSAYKSFFWERSVMVYLNHFRNGNWSNPDNSTPLMADIPEACTSRFIGTGVDAFGRALAVWFSYTYNSNTYYNNKGTYLIFSSEFQTN